MSAKFELKKTANEKFHFTLKASNGQVILSSEVYESKASANNGIESVRKNASDDARFERKSSTKGDHYFVLKAANHQVIGQSQMYASADSMESGIKSVATNAAAATLDDAT